MSQVTFESLVARISEIRDCERITKSQLSSFSREALAFVMDSKDVRIVNMILGVDDNNKSILTPANRRIANRYFAAMLPFQHEGDMDGQIVFTKMKARVTDKYAIKISAFLAVPSNDIWTWQKENIQMEPKEIDYTGKLTTATKKALSDGHVTELDALKAVLAGGISVEAMLALVSEMTAPVEEKAA